MNATLVPLAQAFQRANLDPRRSSLAHMFAVDLLVAAGHEVPSITCNAPKLRQDKQSVASARIQAIAAGYQFQINPNPKTFGKWNRAHVRAFGSSILALSDQYRETAPTIHPTVRAEPPPAPRPRQVCPTSLEWQTSPSIGRNPADLCEFARKTRVNKPGKIGKPSITCNAQSEITLTVYHRGNPVTDTYPTLARALDDAYNLEPNIPWMICLDGEMIHFYNQGEQIQ